jgi:hypothetical protein
VGDAKGNMTMAEAEAGDCEIQVRTFVGGLVGLRERGDPRKPYLVLTAPEWRSFLLRVKRGELDRIGARGEIDGGDMCAAVDRRGQS